MIKNVSVFLLTIMYFLSGITKIRTFDSTVANVQNKFSEKLMSIPKWLAVIGLILVILLEIGAPLIINYSVKVDEYKEIALYAIYGLILFTIFVSLLYYFPPVGRNYYPFISNVTVIGGLLLLSVVYRI